MNAKTKQFDKSIDTSNNLEQTVDLLHIQSMVINQLVADADDEHNNRLELKLDDLMSLNNVIIKRIDKQSGDMVNRAITQYNR